MKQQRIHWYRTPVEKEKLHELTQRSDLVPLLHILAQLLIFAITGTLAYLSYVYIHWTVFVLVLFVHCSLAGHLYAPVHEMLHKTPFKSRRLNEFFLKLCSFFLWSNYVLMRIGHLNHHQVTVYNGRDYENPMPRVYKPWHWILFWTVVPFDLCWVPGLFSSVGRTVRNAFGNVHEYIGTYFTLQDEQTRKEVVRWARVLLIGHSLLIAAFLYFGLWPLILIVNFPTFIAVGFGQLAGMTQHTGMIHGVPDFRLCSRTVMMHPLLRFFYWNMNYHIEHHMYAAVPYLKLAALRREIEYDLPPASPNLRAAWREISAAVKRQRTDPGYSIVPVVPNSGAD